MGTQSTWGLLVAAISAFREQGEKILVKKL